MDYSEYLNEAVALLCRLIATPSTSRDETAAADIMEAWMAERTLCPHRVKNNVWAVAPGYSADKPTLLLNAHIDTVRPVSSWTRNPYSPDIVDGKLYGLGSNDCGGGLVALLQAFRLLGSKPQPYNLVYLASAEEEVSGSNGIVCALPELPQVSVAVVGEPTTMQPAVAEKGLMVLDVVAEGRSGHAARGEGVNAIYEAMHDIDFIRNYHFEKESELLGPTLMQLTMIKAGTQHNVVPDRCEMVVDVRTNEHYRNEDVYEFLCQQLHSHVSARSFRLHSSHIPLSHPIVGRCVDMGLTPFGSPTLSDQALMPFPSLKLGPGHSARSHSADEYIGIAEIGDAIGMYVELLDGTDIR